MNGLGGIGPRGWCDLERMMIASGNIAQLLQASYWPGFAKLSIAGEHLGEISHFVWGDSRENRSKAVGEAETGEFTRYRLVCASGKYSAEQATLVAAAGLYSWVVPGVRVRGITLFHGSTKEQRHVDLGDHACQIFHADNADHQFGFIWHLMVPERAYYCRRFLWKRTKLGYKTLPDSGGQVLMCQPGTNGSLVGVTIEQYQPERTIFPITAC